MSTSAAAIDLMSNEAGKSTADDRIPIEGRGRFPWPGGQKLMSAAIAAGRRGAAKAEGRALGIPDRPLADMGAQVDQVRDEPRGIGDQNWL